MKANSWQTRFGAKRRAIDRALLAACEKALNEPEEAPITFSWPSPSQEAEEAALAIARAFGRPIQ